MINKAFIFDLDGVIIDSERWWDKYEGALPGHSLGQSINSAFDSARKIHPNLNWKTYFGQLNHWADKIYHQAPITPGVDDLIEQLLAKNYLSAVVSGSTGQWINWAQERLKNPIPVSLSLHERPDLKPKPAPDGYLEAMKILKIRPGNTIILEDSQPGVISAKASGAFTICFTGLHPQNYRAPGADLYVKTLDQVPV